VEPWRPDAGERIVWRERRGPPVAIMAGVPAVLLAGMAVAAADAVASLLLGAGALACAALGYRLRDRAWVEELVLTDRRAVVASRAGEAEAAALAGVRHVVVRGARVAFHGDDGRLVFAHVRAVRALRRRLAELAPALDQRDEIDPRCPT
jgi:hypothetical protein